MNIYEFSRALANQKPFLKRAFAVLLILTLLMVFTIKDGRPQWRLGPKYEASVQIAVVAPNVESLSVTDLGPGDFRASAALFGEMLKSAEAAYTVGFENGYELADLITVNVAQSAPLIEVKLIGPTEEQTKGAALSAFEWLVSEIKRTPVTADLPVTPTPSPLEKLDGSFDSTIKVETPAGASSLPADLFMIIDTGQGELAYQLRSSAGTTKDFSETLSRQMSLVLRLQDAAGRNSDPVRVTIPDLAQFVTELPVLSISLNAESIVPRQLGDADVASNSLPWSVVADAVDVAWQRGAPLPGPALEPTRDLKVLLLTPDPLAAPTGERRGPIVTIAFLAVGSLVILTLAITIETWRREYAAHAPREDQEQEPPKPKAVRL